MDVAKLLNKVKNLNQYISATEDVVSKYKNQKIQFNMSTVLALKKVRSLEIEYFNKCEGNGAGFAIIERMLELPPSKTWGLLGKEMVSLLQYWLDATRKHLISHTPRWWSFLNFLLKFIKDIRLKDNVLPDILVEGTAERLLDLATRSEPDVLQRQEILHCLNMCCADSSREIRFALRHHFENYFVKLSALLATSGHLPTQYGILETLLRWLLPRQNVAVRQAAAAKWFPDQIYGRNAVEIFLERQWQNFPQDARDFLNAHNAGSDLVVSVVCRKLTVGAIVVISGKERRDAWLDVNSSSRCISILLDPRMLEALGGAEQTSIETLLVNDDDVHAAQLSRESIEIKITMKMANDVQLYPSAKTIPSSDVTMVVSSRSDLRRLDNALRCIFRDKYQVLLDFVNAPPLSPRKKCDETAKVCSSSEEDTRLSHPVQVARRRHGGYIVRSKANFCKSPSTASTTSLALLHDRLSALPSLKFDKEPVKVSALPDLSCVTELTEIDDRQSLASGSTFRPRSGVCHKRFRRSEKSSQSDGEKHQSRKYMSPINEELNSCLLMATIGSDESVINDTLERLSKNKNYQPDNIVDLLVQEALQTRDSGINTEDNRKTQDAQIDSETIENTPDVKKKQSLQPHNKVHNNVHGVSDDSNEIKDTQLDYVSVRKRNLGIRNEDSADASDNPIGGKEHTFDQEAIEKFFSQHITEDERGGLVVSPTLARKVNETSSESDHLDEYLIRNANYPNIGNMQSEEILDCLNIMVDKVCSDFDKCAKMLGNDTGIDLLNIANADDEMILQEETRMPVLTSIENVNIIAENVPTTKKNVPKSKKTIKLKFPTKKGRRTTLQTSRQKRQLESKITAPKMSTIPEVRDTIERDIIETNDVQDADTSTLVHRVEEELVEQFESVQAPKDNQISNNKKVPLKEINNKNISSKSNSPEISTINRSPNNDFDTPLIRRKRKLYSPKDDHTIIENEDHVVVNPETGNKESTELNISNKTKTPQFKATSYKEIEKERKRYIRQPRVRKSRSKKERTPSPRTIKMNDLFDKLKENVESNENIVFADKKSIERGLAAYNFSDSDSEDEDFKKKTKLIRKRISSTTIASGDSIISTRRGRLINRVNYSEKSSDEIKKPVKQKTPVRRKKTQHKRYNLADEKMREAVPEALNTSLIVEKPVAENKEPELVLVDIPQMEVMTDDEYTKQEKPMTRQRKAAKKNKANTALALKTEKKRKGPHVTNDNDDRTLSPLPGLVVEQVPARRDDPNDSVSTQMMTKLKKFYRDGPDAVDESNTTQNLLLDNEKVDFSLQNLNITNELDELGFVVDFGNQVIDNTEIDTKETKVKSIKKSKSTNKIQDGKVDDASVTQLPNKSSKDKDGIDTIEIVNISCDSEVKSEASFATVGKSPIRGHCDLNEIPPGSRQLDQRVSPRNLELEGMDQSTQDYFLKLRNEVFENLNNSNEQITVKVNAREKSMSSNSVKSPVVSLTRLSIDDISKWLPSRRNSDTDSSCSRKISPIKNISEISDAKTYVLRSNRSTELDEKDIEKESRKIKVEKTVKSNPKPKQSKTEIETISNTSISTIIKRKSNKQIVKDIDPSCSQNRNTVISPIIFDDLFKTLNIPQHTDKIKATETNTDESKAKKCIKTTKNVPKTYNLRNNISVHGSESNVSSSTRRDNTKSSKISIKRKSESSISQSSKRRKVQNVVLYESGPSVSSVNEWFNRIEPISTAESINQSYREGLQNVMEKLDTTLVEIHQNTSKKFIHVFVDVQKQLTELKEERLRVCRQVATEVLSEVARAMEAKFADLEKRTQEMDGQFMEHLKRRAAEVIREDCKQKQAMVELLKEDLRAVARFNATRDT